MKVLLSDAGIGSWLTQWEWAKGIMGEVDGTGPFLKFDPTVETVPDDREANGLLTNEYRKPWEL